MGQFWLLPTIKPGCKPGPKQHGHPRNQATWSSCATFKRIRALEESWIQYGWDPGCWWIWQSKGSQGMSKNCTETKLKRYHLDDQKTSCPRQGVSNATTIEREERCYMQDFPGQRAVDLHSPRLLLMILNFRSPELVACFELEATYTKESEGGVLASIFS